MCVIASGFLCWVRSGSSVDFFFFFFSSRRRHTRWPRDWSSDVCSSDLVFMVAFDVLHAVHEIDVVGIGVVVEQPIVERVSDRKSVV